MIIITIINIISSVFFIATAAEMFPSYGQLLFITKRHPCDIFHQQWFPV